MNDQVQIFPHGQSQQPVSPPPQVDSVVSQSVASPNVSAGGQMSQNMVANTNRPGAMPQVFSQVLSDQVDQLAQSQQAVQQGFSSGKEQAPNTSSEMGYDVYTGQPVEIEHGAEISPEVEKFIEEIQDHDGQVPQEIVVADQTVTQPTGKYVAKPVIVLPMTESELIAGKKASPLMSKRWLAEWVEKIMKMFEGSVVYREE